MAVADVVKALLNSVVLVMHFSMSFVRGESILIFYL